MHLFHRSSASARHLGKKEAGVGLAGSRDGSYTRLVLLRFDHFFLLWAPPTGIIFLFRLCLARIVGGRYHAARGG